MSNTEVPDPVTYYAEQLKKHGVRPAAVDVTREGQQMRFQLLLDALGETHQCSILDVGCGYGAFKEFLIANGRWSADYTGVDICPEMVAAAEGMRPNTKFFLRDIVTNPFPRQYDFVVASGLFQFNHAWGPVEAMIKAMWDHTKGVLAFNMLSVSTPQAQWDNVEFHADPGRLENFCRSLTKLYTLDHGYRENDFTMIMRREPRQMLQNVG